MLLIIGDAKDRSVVSRKIPRWKSLILCILKLIFTIIFPVMFTKSVCWPLLPAWPVFNNCYDFFFSSNKRTNYVSVYISKSSVWANLCEDGFYSRMDLRAMFVLKWWIEMMDPSVMFVYTGVRMDPRAMFVYT